MKKIVVFILIVLSFSMIFTQVSCADNSQEPESTSNVVLLSGLDDFKELRTFKFNETFGIAEIIDDAEYVTEGSRAAKFTVDGGYVGIPEVSVFTNTPYCSEKDFSKVQALSVDMYNTDTKVHTVEISFTTPLFKLYLFTISLMRLISFAKYNIKIPLMRSAVY